MLDTRVCVLGKTLSAWAAAVRNPVTNIATMLGSTDIPDWFTHPIYSSPGVEIICRGGS